MRRFYGAETTKAGSPRPCLECARGARSALRLALRFLFLRLRAVHQLHQGHRRVVAQSEPRFQDAEIPAAALGVAGPELAEKLGDHLAVAQAVERQAAV